MKEEVGPSPRRRVCWSTVSTTRSVTCERFLLGPYSESWFFSPFPTPLEGVGNLRSDLGPEPHLPDHRASVLSLLIPSLRPSGIGTGPTRL